MHLGPIIGEHAEPMYERYRAPAVRLRIGELELPRDTAQVGLRLRHAQGWLQSTEDDQPAPRSLLKRTLRHGGHGHRLHVDWNPDLRREARCRSAEPARRNADDRVRIAIERDRAANDAAVTAERVVPEVIAQYDYGARSGCALVGRLDEAPQCRVHAERR